MVGNMIELNRPIATSAYTASIPPLAMVRPSSSALIPANTDNNTRGDNLASSAEPMKRPIIASVQYAET